MSVEGDQCPVVAKPLSLPVERGSNAVLDVVDGGRQLVFLWVEESTVLVVGKCYRTGHRLNLFGIGVGIAKRPVHTIIIRLREEQ